MGIYFDHSSSGLVDEDVLQIYEEALRRYNYNPASIHADGRSSRREADSARERIAAVLDCRPEEVIFTSGGSESINTAIKSAALTTRRRGHRLISDMGEHPATLESLRFVQEYCGRDCELLPLKEGLFDVQALRRSLESEPADLISVMWVHNESGAVYPIEKIAALKKELSPAAQLHIDAVQAQGKIPLSFRKSGADMMSLSTHKLGTPKGLGILLVRSGLPFIPLIHGGGQQGGRRSGTENPALIIAAAFALEKKQRELESDRRHCQELKSILLSALNEGGTTYKLLSPEGAVPQINLLFFPELRGETLLNGLSAAAYDISTGSACSSDKSADSGLLALGLSADESRHVIRVSLSEKNTAEEVRDLVREIRLLLDKYGQKA